MGRHRGRWVVGVTGHGAALRGYCCRAPRGPMGGGPGGKRYWHKVGPSNWAEAQCSCRRLTPRHQARSGADTSSESGICVLARQGCLMLLQAARGGRRRLSHCMQTISRAVQSSVGHPCLGKAETVLAVASGRPGKGGSRPAGTRGRGRTHRQRRSSVSEQAARRAILLRETFALRSYRGSEAEASIVRVLQTMRWQGLGCMWVGVGVGDGEGFRRQDCCQELLHALTRATSWHRDRCPPLLHFPCLH
jgi:hypothetical protein